MTKISCISEPWEHIVPCTFYTTKEINAFKKQMKLMREIKEYHVFWTSDPGTTRQ